MNFRQKSVMFLATGGFVGKIPFAPGTFGTVVGLLFCFLLSRIDLAAAIPATIFFIAAAVLISGEASKILDQDDPGCIVIDEIAGIAVTLLGLPFDTVVVVAGFFIFRVLDILKPFPIRYVENKLKGGTGIVMDDVAAGLMGHIVLRTALVWIG
jgi:phosphatidylglycerophosphatase A